MPDAVVADLPLGQPLEEAQAFQALVAPHLLTESVPAVLRFLRSAQRLEAQGATVHALGEAPSGVQQREEHGCVSLEEVLGYQFNDPVLERTARVHSCALPIVVATQCTTS